MLNTEIVKNSSLFPEGFRREYDAHIYFQLEQLEQVLALRERALTAMSDYPIFIGNPILRPIGPHPMPTFEMNFSKDEFKDMLFWLIQNRGKFSVLVHQCTGNDPEDHSQGAIWLGPPVDLIWSKLDPAPASQSSSSTSPTQS